jgi:hypothetical protein
VADDPLTATREGRPNVDGGGGGNAMTAKMMGLPTWAWLALAAAGAITIVVWRQSRNKTPASTDTNAPTDGSSDGLSLEQYETLMAQNQNILGILDDLQGAPSTEPGDPTTGPATQPVGGGSTKPVAQQPAAGSKRGYGWYKVVKGDSAASIAKKYSIPVTQFYAFNGPGRLVAGDYVKVRAASKPVVGPYKGK